MYKIFLMLRYLRKRRIAYFAISAISLCVAMVLVVHSVMSGFLDTVRNSSRNLLGDVILEIGGMESFPYFDEFISEIQKELGEELVAATPVIMNAGLLKLLAGGNDHTALIYVNGIRLNEYRKINSFAEGLYYDKYFPGTTKFDPAPIPTWFLDDNGIARLPDEYEAALQQYLKGADAKEAAKYERKPYELYPGPCLFMPSIAEDIAAEDPDRTGYVGDPLPGIILGVDLFFRPDSKGVYERFFSKGALVRLTVLSVTRFGTVTADPTSTAGLRVVDDSRTKIYDIDAKTVYCDFEWLQRQLGYNAKEYLDGSGMSPPRATQILIKLTEGADFNSARDRLSILWKEFVDIYEPRIEPDDLMKMRHGMQIQTWEDRNRRFFLAVEKERVLMLILFALISLVAVVLVGCIFFMIVQEKTREIGIIKSMGATSRGVASIFLVYAFAIGVVGSGIGITIGALFVRYINEIQDFLASLNPQLRVWSAETYAFDRIPNVVKPFDAMVIVVVAISASMLGSVVAARKAARIWPVDAIRYE